MRRRTSPSLDRGACTAFAVLSLLQACASTVTMRDDVAADLPSADSPSVVDAADTPSALDTANIDAPFDRVPPPDAPGIDARGDAVREGGPPIDDGIPPDVPMPPPGTTVCGGTVCATGEVCCVTTLRCFPPSNPSACPTPPRTTNPNACASNADCPTGQWCGADGRAGSYYCSGVGSCRAPLPLSDCGPGTGPVCGCDGRTYANPCAASLVGIRTGQQRACGAQLLPPSARSCRDVASCGPFTHCDLVAGRCAPDAVLFACGTDAQCPSGQQCCRLNGVCLDASRSDLCVVPPPSTDFPCATDTDCSAWSAYFSRVDNFCFGTSCVGPGGCGNLPSTCTGVFTPVCACNGRTYTNECTARMDRQRIAHAGMCP